MKPSPFKYLRPHSLDDALSMRAVGINGVNSIYEADALERIVRDLQTDAVPIANTRRRFADASAHMLLGPPP